MDARRLDELIRAGAAPLILDVRSRREFEAGHVPGALHVPFWRAGSAPIPAAPDDAIVIYCGHGPRAAAARALLRGRGFRRIACLSGHMAGWRRSRLPEAGGE